MVGDQCLARKGPFNHYLKLICPKYHNYKKMALSITHKRNKWKYYMRLQFFSKPLFAVGP